MAGSEGREEEQQQLQLFGVGSEVEVRTDEEGFKGALFRATIVTSPTNSASKKRKRALVEYKNLVTEDGSKQLKEYVDSEHLRPTPPQLADRNFEEGDVVDADYRDGWWTGVVGKVVENNSKYSVVFDNPPDLIEFQRDRLRLHQDWVNGEWVRPNKQEVLAASDTPQELEHLLPAQKDSNNLEVATKLENLSAAEENPESTNSGKNLMEQPSYPRSVKDKKMLARNGSATDSRPVKKLKDDKAAEPILSITPRQLRKTPDNKEMPQELPQLSTGVRGTRRTRKPVVRHQFIKTESLLGKNNVKTKQENDGEVNSQWIHPVASKGRRTKSQTGSRLIPEAGYVCALPSQKREKEKDKEASASVSLAGQNVQNEGNIKETEVPQTIWSTTKGKEVTLAEKPAQLPDQELQVKDQKKSANDPAKPAQLPDQELQVKDQKKSANDPAKPAQLPDQELQVKDQKKSANDPAKPAQLPDQELQVKDQKKSANDPAKPAQLPDQELQVKDQKKSANDPAKPAQLPDQELQVKDQKKSANDPAKPAQLPDQELQVKDQKKSANDPAKPAQLPDQELQVKDQKKSANDPAKPAQLPDQELQVKDQKKSANDPAKPAQLPDQELQVKDQKKSANDPANEKSMVMSAELGSDSILANLLRSLVTFPDMEFKQQQAGGSSHKRKRGRPRKLAVVRSRASDGVKGQNMSGNVADKNDKNDQTPEEAALHVLRGMDSTAAKDASKRKTADFPGRCKIKEAAPIASDNPDDDDKPLSMWFGGMQLSAYVGESRPSADANVNQHSDRQEPVEVASESPAVDAISGSGPYEEQGLPFVKSSPVWKTIETLEVFRLFPQNPHFRPLVECKEEYREGSAIGNMITFSSLADKISRLQFDDHQSVFDSILESLVDLENYGFNVTILRRRVNDLLSVKDKQGRFQVESRDAEQKIMEHSREKNKLVEEADYIAKKIIELQDKQASIKSEVEAKEHVIARLQMSFDAMNEGIQSARSDFEKLALAPMN
ncbi:hypothetical protein C1H46_034816 [Malus baccata]|uniref:Agenet domain-containing protein n=1 Tax=Malus baccata TaxID=106549 RepID=A0A540KZY5_MALBA|nr:hypothetical protein C1H46_034816 [Malus baccata]